jgi:hypothetical protein
MQERRKVAVAGQVGERAGVQRIVVVSILCSVSLTLGQWKGEREEQAGPPVVRA